MIFWIVIAVFLIIWILIGYSIITAPLMPDDYEIKSKDIWPLDQQPKRERDPELKIKKNKKKSFNKTQPESLLKSLPPNDYELDN
tara:strand:+ start:4214 stop:4468 length:255 start_codon:yes stop_codon:yes gene_type:complete